MEEIVKLELVDLARIEALPDVLEQRSQMFLVVGAHDGQRIPPLLVDRSISRMGLLGHGDERTSIRRGRSRMVDLGITTAPCIGTNARLDRTVWDWSKPHPVS